MFCEREGDLKNKDDVWIFCWAPSPLVQKAGRTGQNPTTLTFTLVSWGPIGGGGGLSSDSVTCAVTPALHVGKTNQLVRVRSRYLTWSEPLRTAGMTVEYCGHHRVPVMWIRIKLGSVFRNFVDPDPYSNTDPHR